MAETELAREVSEWLQASGWDVYPEVQLSRWGGRADLVAVQCNRTWVIECKMSLGLSVIAQAEDWRPFCNWVSVAVPYGNRSRKTNALVYGVLQWRGIGLIHSGHEVRIDIAPRLNRGPLAGDVLAGLNSEQKVMGVAGSKGLFWTPFKQTSKALREYVAQHPGCTLKEAIEGIDHHYRQDTTARSCISQWISKGIIGGIERKRNGKRIELFCEANAPGGEEGGNG